MRLSFSSINKNKLFIIPHDSWNFCLELNFNGKYIFKTKCSEKNLFFICQPWHELVPSGLCSVTSTWSSIRNADRCCALGVSDGTEHCRTNIKMLCAELKSWQIQLKSFLVVYHVENHTVVLFKIWRSKICLFIFWLGRKRSGSLFLQI